MKNVIVTFPINFNDKVHKVENYMYGINLFADQFIKLSEKDFKTNIHKFDEAICDFIQNHIQYLTNKDIRVISQQLTSWFDKTIFYEGCIDLQRLKEYIDIISGIGGSITTRLLVLFCNSTLTLCSERYTKNIHRQELITKPSIDGSLTEFKHIFTYVSNKMIERNIIDSELSKLNDDMKALLSYANIISKDSLSYLTYTDGIQYHKQVVLITMLLSQFIKEEDIEEMSKHSDTFDTIKFFNAKESFKDMNSNCQLFLDVLFDIDGFDIDRALIDGDIKELHRYMTKNNVDVSPLVNEIRNRLINASDKMLNNFLSKRIEFLYEDTHLGINSVNDRVAHYDYFMKLLLNDEFKNNNRVKTLIMKSKLKK